MKQYWTEVKSYLSSKRFILPLLFVLMVCYGYSTVNLSLSIDDTEGNRYIGSGNEMLAAGRLSIVLYAVLGRYVGTLPQSSYVIDLLACLSLLWAAINFCILFRRASGGRIPGCAALVFACTFVSYPLMNEIWEYTGANLVVTMGYLEVSSALLILQNALRRDKQRLADYLFAGGLSFLICAGYESLVSVYVFGVCGALALQIVYGSAREKRVKLILRQALIYAGVLALGLGLRLIFHRLVLFVFQLDFQHNGDTKILWGTAPALVLIRNLILDWIREYLFRGVIYFPIGELVVAGVVLFVLGIIACHRHGWILLIPGFGIYGSLVLISIIQGKISPYRTCQVFAVFVAFTLMMIVTLISNKKNQSKFGFQTVTFVLCGYLCFCQACYLNYFLVCNHIRSEEEAHTVRTIGTELQCGFDMDKPVVFVGNYSLSWGIQEAISVPEDSLRWKMYQTAYSACYGIMGETYDVNTLSRKIPDTNVNSVINWGVSAFGQEGIQHVFSFYGFQYVLPDYDQIREAADLYVEKYDVPCYPQNGYIQDAGEYIVVHLG